MYERMLEKQNKPTIEAMKAYCGEASSLFTILHSWLMQYSDITYDIVFPYGNHYGWGIAFRKKNKLICNIFPEKDAFTVMIRLTNQQFESAFLPGLLSVHPAHLLLQNLPVQPVLSVLIPLHPLSLLLLFA